MERESGVLATFRTTNYACGFHHDVAKGRARGCAEYGLEALLGYAGYRFYLALCARYPMLRFWCNLYLLATKMITS